MHIRDPHSTHYKEAAVVGVVNVSRAYMASREGQNQNGQNFDTNVVSEFANGHWQPLELSEEDQERQNSDTHFLIRYMSGFCVYFCVFLFMCVCFVRGVYEFVERICM